MSCKVGCEVDVVLTVTLAQIVLKTTYQLLN
jgi:hypothetical protein